MLQWRPVRPLAGALPVGIWDRMHLRSLLIGMLTALTAFAALAVLALPASAQDAATAPPASGTGLLCLEPGGTVKPAPPAETAGAPQSCPPPSVPAGQAPDAPAAPPATDPGAQPGTGTPPAEDPGQGENPAEPGQDDDEDDKSQPQPEPKPKKKKAKAKKQHRRSTTERRRSGREERTGPDDGNPPPPPSSLLKAPTDTGTGAAPPAGSGGSSDPLYVLAPPPSASVPNILLDRFRVPPFLLPIYQAAGVEYGVRWEILAAINSIETDYGRNLSVSTAGAMGWMQFMPGTWKSYGVDANGDGRKDPYNPVDAIFAAARYLKAAGAATSLQRAIFAYNHAQWYVDDVLQRARALSAIPPAVIGSLSGLTLGRFPIAAPATYAGRITTKRGKVHGPDASVSITDRPDRRSMRIFAQAGSPVVAVQDARVVALGTTERLGRFIRVRDAYGNTYTYGHLASVAKLHPVAKQRRQSERSVRRELGLGRRDPKPTAPASAGRTPKRASGARAGGARPRAARVEVLDGDRPAAATPHQERVRAFTLAQAPAEDEAVPVPAGVTAFRAYFAEPRAVDRRDLELRPLRVGSRVMGGTVLGRVGAASLERTAGADAADRRAARAAAQQFDVAQAPHALFEIRPAGRKSPRIDPKPILDGWRLLDSTAIYRAKSAFTRGDDATRKLTIGQIMLMSKPQLQRHVLGNRDIEIYECGRRDIAAGIVDRRVLASLEFLAAKGMKPTVTSLRCGHGYLTASGNVSQHSFGSAVDIAAINGTPITGHQGPGSITDRAVRALLTLQGTMKPDQIITLMQYAGTDNTLAMADHYDHIHLGFRPQEGEAAAALRPKQWDRLVNGLQRIRNPIVPVRPSAFSVKVTKRASASSAGHDHDDHDG